jgi:HSP20 family protein
LLPELPSLFNDSIVRDWFNWGNTNHEQEASTVPSVNICEHEANYEITVAAPGMSKTDFKVELQDNRLIISGERKEEKEQKQGSNYLRKEFNYQSFVRSFTLAEKQVEREKIQAKYADGILCITVPKTPEAKTKAVKTIQIS